MKNKLHFMLALFLLLAVQLSFAQQKTVTGTVTDESGPLPGVSIIIKGTTTGTETDFDGNYSIQVNTGDVLVFSFLGMKRVERTVGAESTINLVMEQDNILDEVIVVAYGTVKKSDYTGAATQINSEEISNRSISSVTNAIEGKAAGVAVSSGSGQPGSSQSIRIRGFGSVNASSDPLYVVDGMPFYGTLSSINPSDVESMTILKDASSTALYGNKAANGVVMITTKKGKNRKGVFSVSASTSIINRAIPEYDQIGPEKYYETMWESLRNSRAIPGVDDPADVTAANIFASEKIKNQLGNNPFNVPDDQIVGTDGRINPSARLLYPDDLDWTDAITKMGVRQNYDISYQGGSESTDYYVSLGYLDEEGYIKYSDFNRFTGRANVNYQANKWLKTGFNVSGTMSKGNQAQATSSQSNSFVNPIRFTRGMGPIYNIYQHGPNGEYILDENGNKQYYLNDNRPKSASPGRHIIAEMDLNTDIREFTTLSAKTYFDINLAKGLVFTTNASVDQRHRYYTDYQNKLVGDGATGGRAGREYDRRTIVGFNQLLKYNVSFGNHNIDALVGHESVQDTRNNFSGNRADQIADGNDELLNFVTTTSLESYTTDVNDESYLSRLSYDYNGKYFLSGSFRTDGTSKFSKDRRWGQFWSIGGAWRLDREDFIKRDWMNLLKLRASYGELGNNQGIDEYAYQSLYSLDYNNQADAGYYNTGSLEALDLEWETSASYDVALEFGLFNRLNGVIEYYNRESQNLLFENPLRLSSGSEFILKNIGTMYNKGIEVSLNGDIVKTESFNWNLGVNVTSVKNQFKELPQEEIEIGSKKLMVGRSIYDYWLKNWYGVDPSDGSALYIPTEEAITEGGSDIRTVNGTTVTTKVAKGEYHYAGTAIPDFTGGLSSSFTYNNVSLNFLFTYQVGGKILDYNYRGLMSAGDYGNAIHPDIFDRWQKPGDITNVPRLDGSKLTDFDATSDRWLTDASYLNLKQVNLSYNLPENLINNLNISSAQIYINGENLFFLNKRKGMDIQEDFNGTTSNVYSPSRIMTLGLNIKF